MTLCMCFYAAPRRTCLTAAYWDIRNIAAHWAEAEYALEKRKLCIIVRCTAAAQLRSLSSIYIYIQLEPVLNAALHALETECQIIQLIDDTPSCVSCAARLRSP